MEQYTAKPYEPKRVLTHDELRALLESASPEVKQTPERSEALLAEILAAAEKTPQDKP